MVCLEADNCSGSCWLWKSVNKLSKLSLHFQEYVVVNNNLRTPWLSNTKVYLTCTEAFLLTVFSVYCGYSQISTDFSSTQHLLPSSPWQEERNVINHFWILTNSCETDVWYICSHFTENELYYYLTPYAIWVNSYISKEPDWIWISY